MLNLGTFRIRGQREDEYALVVSGCEFERRFQGPEPEVGRNRDRIRGQRRGGVEVGLRVGAHGRPDITAFDVEDGEQPGVPGRSQGLLESGDSGGAVLLEERGLRLDRSHRTLEFGDRSEGELPYACGTGRQPPGGQQMLVRVDAHAQRSVLVHGGRQSGAEHQALQSCRLRTSNFESRMTSREVTAAANSASVVISGTEFAVAAARIS